MREERFGYVDDPEEASGIAAVAALATFCGIALAVVVLVLALVGWRLPL